MVLRGFSKKKNNSKMDKISPCAGGGTKAGGKDGEDAGEGL